MVRPVKPLLDNSTYSPHVLMFHVMLGSCRVKGCEEPEGSEAAPLHIA